MGASHSIFVWSGNSSIRRILNIFRDWQTSPLIENWFLNKSPWKNKSKTYQMVFRCFFDIFADFTTFKFQIWQKIFREIKSIHFFHETELWKELFKENPKWASRKNNKITTLPAAQKCGGKSKRCCLGPKLSMPKSRFENRMKGNH